MNDIDILNKIIEKAIFYGGDSGGPYYNDDDLGPLLNYMMSYMEYNNLCEDYQILIDGPIPKISKKNKDDIM